ncbi:MAG: fructose-1,6-bisphosphate aldolase, partial [SAR324 cluster bacterium]|nr:fructose-1,6-bisphosphate aldolase [SAR324 cluster bacterium]
AMQVVCESRYESFGTAGNASKLKPLPLTAMAGRYNSGELEQKIN